jgi:cation transport ATPase
MNAAEALHARWTPDAGEHEHVVLLVEGMHCANCARSIEKAVRALPDVTAVRVNNVTARLSAAWLGRGATG